MPRADQQLRSASSPSASPFTVDRGQNRFRDRNLSGMSPDSFVNYLPDRSHHLTRFVSTWLLCRLSRLLGSSPYHFGRSTGRCGRHYVLQFVASDRECSLLLDSLPVWEHRVLDVKHYGAIRLTDGVFPPMRIASVDRGLV